MRCIVERAITQPLSSVAFSPRLGAGEREAIVLALEIGNCYLLLDDLAARRTAQALGINVVGTVGLCLRAKQQGLIEEIKPLLDTLLLHEFRISSRLYNFALAEARET